MESRQSILPRTSFYNVILLLNIAKSIKFLPIYYNSLCVTPKTSTFPILEFIIFAIIM
jgi:hypothetical protein